MNYPLKKRLKKVTRNDFYHIFLFLIALPLSFFYRNKNKHLWLLCEYKYEARDNAYHLFRYLCKSEPNINAVYAIARNSNDYTKVSTIGKTVEYATLKHWILYLSCACNISSQKGGKPNAAVCYMLEVKLKLVKTKRVFLQHGITKDDIPSFYYDDTYFSLFMCAANPEYKYIQKNYGYPTSIVQNLGFCRYDALQSISTERKIILLMPTWRDYLFTINEKFFLKSDFYKNWQNLLQSQMLQDLIKNYKAQVLFYPHRNMSKFLHLFTGEFSDVVNWNETGTQELIRRASILVTDYSSIAMDFAYMKKPLIYFQFDYATFRKEHAQSGYFNYDRDGFGLVCKSISAVENELKKILNTGKMSEKYLMRQKNFFSYNDTNNCKRTTEAIKTMLEETNYE